MSDDEQRDFAGPERCSLVARDCPWCGCAVRSNEHGGVCANCGCSEPEAWAPTRDQLQEWISLGEAVLAKNPDETGGLLAERIADWRAAVARMDGREV